jgi:hypothetical protein
MGNVKNKHKQGMEEYEKLILDTFKNTGMEFTQKDLLGFKLKIHDLENYFYYKFDYFVYFNSYVFRQRLSILYDNFGEKIEEAAAKKGSLSILVDFDDNEVSYLTQGSKPDFDPLFTVIFEKLEMGVILFFNMTNLDDQYIKEFFTQMVESIELYKYNRKFDCIYMLLPNTDFFIKNNVGIFYVTNKKLGSKNISDFKNKYVTAIFGQDSRNNLIQCKYQKTEVNDFFETFIERANPTFVKLMINFVFNTDLKNFHTLNEEQFDTLIYVTNKSPLINLIIDISSLAEDFIDSSVFETALKKIIEIQINCPRRNMICIRLISENKKKEVDRSLSALVAMLNSHIRIVSNKEPIKRKFITELYTISPVPEDEDKFNVAYEKVSITYGNIDESIEMDTLIHVFKNPKYKNLGEKKIIKHLRAFLNTNYNIKHTKDGQISTQEEYIKYIY